uniref:FHA domain-containing protein n=1 Tax=Chenopodium quinoa TaxID=63459 RepID=A0A803LJT9_CHEQI
MVDIGVLNLSGLKLQHKDTVQDLDMGSKDTTFQYLECCDVNITNDKGVSRIHAEIIVDVMESLKPAEKRSSSISSKVRIRDCSKYGTFIVKDSGIKEKVHDCPGKEIYLKVGDLVKFGSGDLTYRFSYVPLNFYLCNFTSSQGTPFTQDKISSIGACVSHEWTKECTHVLVDPFMPVTEEVIDIVLSKKPVVLSTWLEIIAGTRIHSEIPSYSQYIPTLTLDGESVSIADTRTRENCLKGYTFVLGSANKYRFKDRVQSLLEVAGAKVLSINYFDNNIQDQVETDKCLALVIPADSAEKFCLDSSLSKVNEIKLISAVLSGYLDPSIIMSSSILVSSSCSTDETVVADSDAEAETATSDHPSAISEELMMQNKTKYFSGTEATDCMNIDKKSANKDASSPEVGEVLSFLEPKREAANARNDDLESWNLDILYSQNLIVRNTNTNDSVSSVSDGEVVNFKRFRKTNIQSGNSFSNLVPYSKYPYTDSDYDKEVVEYVKDEKKRKQMEAMAEDLFKNERGWRRGVAGSIQEMLSRN